MGLSRRNALVVQLELARHLVDLTPDLAVQDLRHENVLDLVDRDAQLLEALHAASRGQSTRAGSEDVPQSRTLAR